MLIISNKIFILSITLNPSDYQNFMVLIFFDMGFDDNRLTTFIEKFLQVIAIMNLIAITQFFEIIYTAIFKLFLIIESIKDNLLGLVLTYFEMVKIND